MIFCLHRVLSVSKSWYSNAWQHVYAIVDGMLSLFTRFQSSLAKHGILIFALLFLGFFITLYVGQRIYYSLSIHLNTAIENNRQETAKKSSAQKYEELLAKQEADKEVPVITLVPQRRARGTFPISIVLVKPPTLSDVAVVSLVETLKDPRSTIFNTCSQGTCAENTSLAFIPSYLQQEAAKYGISDFAVDLSIRGVYPLKNLEKIGDLAYSWNKDMFGVAKVQDAFESLLKENDIDTSGLTMFLYFDDSYQAEGDIRQGSFYEYKKFRSFANEGKSRAYVNVYQFTPTFSKTVTLVVLHEVLHLFGASDKYIENPDSDKICSVKGLGNPDQNPVHPQTTGDIMCLYIEKSDTDIVRGSLTDENLVINAITAKEIGWR